jgi:hypothetical protein
LERRRCLTTVWRVAKQLLQVLLQRHAQPIRLSFRRT